MCEKQNKTEDIKSLKEYSEYKDRVEYIEDRQNKTAILRLHNVTENDERAYCFRVVTKTEGQQWIGLQGIQLNVSALQVKAPQLVLEKKRVNLSCETTCSLTDRFIWYKNGQALNIQNKTLQLQSERSDSGRYSCAVRGHEHLPSPAVNITVMYPPKSVSVSVSPSAEIVEGDSVTLICSSDSNPPALNFSWFKENQSLAVGFGQSFNISSFNSSHNGRYYCEAQNEYGSERSASVSVTVKGNERLIQKNKTEDHNPIRRSGGSINSLIIVCRQLESPGDTYMTLEPKSRCSEYDTLDGFLEKCGM
ncbi:B-cell receptor CD22-like [Garra rufa]|uniref:B-cell receptor CD22-like n=1 Tax=Garra rufa TaxID=137080 RepID=UPI003CCE5D4F